MDSIFFSKGIHSQSDDVIRGLIGKPKLKGFPDMISLPLYTKVVSVSAHLFPRIM